MSTDFDAFAGPWRERFNRGLTRFLPQPDAQRPQLADAMAYSLANGGKRVRPMLVYGTGAALRHEPDEALDTVAVALECLHAYSLIHDDLPAMDDDDLRRGQPSCHIAFDEATAILAGDALQALAFEVLARCDRLSAEQRVALIADLAQAAGAQGMVLGQAIDLGAVHQTPDIAQLERMHQHKTGALIRASVAMAARACGASNRERAALGDYAGAIGLAFQVQDDILDVIADTDTLGKPQGADTARDKPTYVSLLGLEGAQHKARELLNQALDSLSAFDESAAALRSLARYIIERGH
ncbi:(2E,6E)-farnesyl diphosphate synthase [Marinimicrobium sp. C6131]|uniref:(2E,6E)-farnesyl diphosphate synthase n=1 Tax=Marinimicrobium sp. C6131 TaxID=3022676 RepID=UPI00223CA0FD|nr:farnesyl diphosphate synthase [Marinimicrobium sp. C6131]UZJ43003.1 (2E,6E)-farnesyl diphosphate synthase [Marinimicrobium sp. C6131]